MSTMLSWHRVGQKVTLVDGPVFTKPSEWMGNGLVNSNYPPNKPETGAIYTIVQVGASFNGEVFFKLAEIYEGWVFRARWFRPIYPQAIQSIRDACVSDPSRVREPA